MPIGNLFGTAANNGSFNSGTIFEITSANKFKVLHTFSFNGGQAPTKGLTLAADGNFYGVGINDDDFATTAGFGSIFKVTSRRRVLDRAHLRATAQTVRSIRRPMAISTELQTAMAAPISARFTVSPSGDKSLLKAIPERCKAGKRILILSKGPDWHDQRHLQRRAGGAYGRKRFLHPADGSSGRSYRQRVCRYSIRNSQVRSLL